MSHYANRNREAAGEIATAMPEHGFVSVFEFSRPAMFDSQTLWTLWFNMKTNEEILTVVDAQGGKGFYKLTPTRDPTIEQTPSSKDAEGASLKPDGV